MWTNFIPGCGRSYNYIIGLVRKKKFKLKKFYEPSFVQSGRCHSHYIIFKISKVYTFIIKFKVSYRNHQIVIALFVMSNITVIWEVGGYCRISSHSLYKLKCWNIIFLLSSVDSVVYEIYALLHRLRSRLLSTVQLFSSSSLFSKQNNYLILTTLLVVSPTLQFI